MIKRKLYFVYVLLFVLLLNVSASGCQMSNKMKAKKMNINDTSIEAQWIRNGAPIEFEGDKWYPVDGIESFLDSEVYFMGKYKGVEFFIDKLDVRPYNRLYTKFDKNKYRYFEKQSKL